MAKPNFWDDTFEQIAELGESTAKKTVKAVQQIADPTQMLEYKTIEEQAKREKLSQEKNNHTPVDFEKLQRQYADKDTKKADALRQRLFQLVKEGDQDVLQQQKKEIQEKQMNERQEEEMKQKRLEEKRRQEMSTAPKGKERKSIMGTKKRVQQEIQTETKASSGKN